MAFMIPTAEYLSEAEAREYVYDALMAEDPTNDADPRDYPAGWYARLSAPGYLDCTDWMGPYKTAMKARAAVMDFYEVDSSGDPTH